MNRMIMKRVLFCLLAIFVMGSFGSLMTGCSDDDEKPGILEEKYFMVLDATYVRGGFPAATSELSVGQVNINKNVLAGGSSVVTINSEEEVSEIYVAVSGETEGYYRFDPTISRAGTNMYNVILLVSQNLEGDFTIRIATKTVNGEITKEFTTNVKYITAGTGALQVSLSFDNEKDVDLYLVKPDGAVIYYGNRDNYREGDDETEGTEEVIYGLDVDSNAGCGIDGINNENIFYPDGYVQSGKYEVWVNMYQNCDRSIATNWVVTVIYKGALLSPTWGQNPVTGVFPVNTPSNSIGSDLNDLAVKVMEFSISDGLRAVMSLNGKKLKPLPESAKLKLQQAKQR
ncbi:hypothetical protein AALK14_21205 [Butyricimonas hominis]|uniref:hypothetical protein n=1 Tax=Butyricimonas TaxID=574697 RepID=UPI00351243F4